MKIYGRRGLSTYTAGYGGNGTGGEGETHQGRMGAAATWRGEHNAPAGRDYLRRTNKEELLHKRPRRGFFFPKEKKRVAHCAKRRSQPSHFYCNFCTDVHDFTGFYRLEVFCLMNQDNQNNQNLWVCIRSGRRPDNTRPFRDSCELML